MHLQRDVNWYVSKSDKHLLLMPLLQFHQLLLMLHVHG